MANILDPKAPLGWTGEGESRKAIIYPDPTWYQDIDKAIRTDITAAYYFRGEGQSHFYFQGVRYVAPPLPKPDTYQAQGSATSPPPRHLSPAPATAAAVPTVLPLPPSAPVSLPTQQVQQQHQNQQPHPLRALPQWPPPQPGQQFSRNDRAFGCLRCNRVCDRQTRIVEHVERAHNVIASQRDVDWVDWGHVRPRYV